MKKQTKKIFVPILITVLMILCFILYFGFVLRLLPGVLLKVLFGIIPAVFAGVMIKVCVQRLKEIKGGEEDDLGQY